MKFRQLFAIPNLLCYLRIALIPYFVVTYLHAQEAIDYLYTALILAVMEITDFLDGFIARRYHMVTEIGKIIDPIADKLLQLTLLVPFYFYLYRIVGISPIAPVSGLLPEAVHQFVAEHAWRPISEIFDNPALLLVILTLMFALCFRSRTAVCFAAPSGALCPCRAIAAWKKLLWC